MKSILVVLLFVALACATPAPSAKAPSFATSKRDFTNPQYSYEQATKDALTSPVNIANVVGSPVRFQSGTGIFADSFQFALDDIVDGLMTNAYDFRVSNQPYANTHFAMANKAASLLAANPITQSIARKALLGSGTTFKVVTNVTDLNTQCAFAKSNHTYGCLLSFSGIDYASEIVVFSDAAQTDAGVIFKNLVYSIIDLLVENYGTSARDPLTGATVGMSAATTHKACFNNLLKTIYGNLPTGYTTDGNGDDPTDCTGVTFHDRVFQYCYDGTPYQFQKDVYTVDYCNSTTEDLLFGDCGPACFVDGSCGNGTKCGFLQCVLDSNYCDYEACVYAQSDTTANRTCCTISESDNVYKYCPPKDDNGVEQTQLSTCKNNGGNIECCDAAGNCAAAASAVAGSCFIATAAYGSSMNPNVWTLRVFRDTYLLTNPLGRLFVNFYYTFSPSVANVIAQSEVLRAATRVFLTPIVALVQALF